MSKLKQAQKEYDEQAQRSCYAKVRSQWKNIESGIKNMQQYLYQQLEVRTLETALQTNHDYYRQELFNVRKGNRTVNEYIHHLNQRVKELESRYHQ